MAKRRIEIPPDAPEVKTELGTGYRLGGTRYFYPFAEEYFRGVMPKRLAMITGYSKNTLNVYTCGHKYNKYLYLLGKRLQETDASFKQLDKKEWTLPVATLHYDADQAKVIVVSRGIRRELEPEKALEVLYLLGLITERKYYELKFKYTGEKELLEIPDVNALSSLTVNG